MDAKEEYKISVKQNHDPQNLDPVQEAVEAQWEAGANCIVLDLQEQGGALGSTSISDVEISKLVSTCEMVSIRLSNMLVLNMMVLNVVSNTWVSNRVVSNMMVSNIGVSFKANENWKTLIDDDNFIN